MELGDESSKERFEAENGMNKMGGSKQISLRITSQQIAAAI
jgi:hypothetical protein